MRAILNTFGDQFRIRYQIFTGFLFGVLALFLLIFMIFLWFTSSFSLNALPMVILPYINFVLLVIFLFANILVIITSGARYF